MAKYNFNVGYTMALTLATLLGGAQAICNCVPASTAAGGITYFTNGTYYGPGDHIITYNATDGDIATIDTSGSKFTTLVTDANYPLFDTANDNYTVAHFCYRDGYVFAAVDAVYVPGVDLGNQGPNCSRFDDDNTRACCQCCCGGCPTDFINSTANSTIIIGDGPTTCNERKLPSACPTTVTIIPGEPGGD